MARCNSLNIKFSNSELRVKSRIKNGNELTLNLSSDLIGNSCDKANFSHKLLLTDTQVSAICKVFASGSSTDMKISKTQLSRMVEIGGFGVLDLLGHPFNPELIFEKLSGSGLTTTSNEVKVIIKAIRSLENRGILLKGTTRKIPSPEGGFLNFLRLLMSACLFSIN